jgi:hypothetical protein
MVGIKIKDVDHLNPIRVEESSLLIEKQFPSTLTRRKENV